MHKRPTGVMLLASAGRFCFPPRIETPSSNVIGGRKYLIPRG